MNLDQLDKLFQSIWMQNQDIPTALSNWQLAVSDYIQTLNSDDPNIDELQSALEVWQLTLEKNRELIEQAQVNITSIIKTGEPTYLQNVQAKKFK